VLPPDGITQMGMGKTAVMIALMTMPTPAAWALELEAPDVWDDKHLYDGDLGYAPRVMRKAQTLVVVCNTLVEQWEREIKKFTGGRLRCAFLRPSDAGLDGSVFLEYLKERLFP